MSNIGLDLTAIDATATFLLGTCMEQPDGGVLKKYKYIKFNDGAANEAGVAGEVAYYAKVAVGDATATIVTSDISDSDNVGAGVLQAALTDGTFGWVQVSGPATLTIALDGSPADGSALTPTGASNGTLDIVVTTVALMNCCAYAIDTTAKIILCDFSH